MAWPYNSAQAKPWEQVELIPLGEAVLCLDCERVGRGKNDHCPGCGSKSVLALKRILNREEVGSAGPALRSCGSLPGGTALNLLTRSSKQR